VTLDPIKLPHKGLYKKTLASMLVIPLFWLAPMSLPQTAAPHRASCPKVWIADNGDGT